VKDIGEAQYGIANAMLDGSNGKKNLRKYPNKTL
jgi:hypothetical protein